MTDDAQPTEIQKVVPMRRPAREGVPLEITPERLLRLKMRMVELQLDQVALAALVGISSSAVSQISARKIKSTRHFPAFAQALKVNLAWLLAETDQRVILGDWKGETVSEKDLPQLLELDEFAQSHVDEVTTSGLPFDKFNRRSDSITVPEIDMVLAGERKVRGIPVKIDGHVFGRDVLATYARANPADVMVITGTGGAMQPTLLDSDLLFLDTSRQKPDGADHIWAFVYSGVVMVRRLRATGKGIRIFSDSPNLPGEMAEDGEVQVLGQVAGFVRRM